MSLSKKLKIDNKKSIHQFLPKELKYLTNVKKIEWKGKKLKTAYLIDIIHKFLSKYYFAKKTHIRMSSSILRKCYGTFYNYYFDYLRQKEIIFLASKYYVNKFCNAYNLNKIYYDSDIIRFKNKDKILLRKWKEKYLEFELDSFNEKKIIDPWIKKKLIKDLEFIEIDTHSAKKELEYLYKTGKIKKDSYYKNIMSVESIDDGSLFYVEDNFGRLHTNFTVLKKVIRNKYLKIDGEEVCELDIKNSQPVFLAKLMKDTGVDKSNLYKNEFYNYFNLVKEGKFYEFIQFKTGLNREECKPFIFKVFFGKNKITKKEKDENKIFKQIFPNLFEWICNVKFNYNDYKILARELQKRESKLIFGEICYKLKKEFPSIKLFTVHDSIFFPKKYEKKVKEIFFNHLEILFS